LDDRSEAFIEMTDIPSVPTSADGVAALDRAITILNAFTTADRSLGLVGFASNAVHDNDRDSVLLLQLVHKV